MAGALKPSKRPDDNVLLGPHAVLEALRAGRPISRVLLSGGSHVRGPLEEIVREARARHVPVQSVDRRRLDLLGRGVRHQGVAAIAAEQALVDLEAVLARARARGEAPFLIALDGVE
ncbi:MAG TPA: RNA methyltransferase substrate-binding domain-containing protein, partial [bacterium]|nr:RNA methyltransferase substrate-binding domain-containing protein [bacterium]